MLIMELFFSSQKNPSFKISQKEGFKPYQFGKTKAPIIGGCLSLITSSMGTDYEIQTDGKILFLEDVDEAPYRIDRMLNQLGHAGKLNKIKGLILGDFHQCNPHSRDASKTSSQTVIVEAIKKFVSPKTPVVFNYPAGHGPIQTIIPIGAQCSMEILKNNSSIYFEIK